MFSNAEYSARKERLNDMVRDSQHYQQVQSVEAAQPKSGFRFLKFLARLWQRKPGLNTTATAQENEAAYPSTPKRLA